VMIVLKAIPQQEFQKMFPAMGTPLGWVHSCSRGVFQKWLLSVSCKYKVCLN
jgi:hypothetical protein